MVRHKLKKLVKRKNVDSVEHIETAAENAPRITNETVASHREEVLSGARKYIYPLQHSKHQIVLITSALFIVAVVAFFTYCTLALYKFHSSSTFLYRVTQVIPFPIAHAGGHFVAYENYLFEVRRYQHYYEIQQKTDFNDPNNKDQLETYKKTALENVVDTAYIKQLAATNHVSVSDKEVDSIVDIVRKQNRLGSNDKGFEQVLHDYYGWSLNDFKRSLRDELLTQKVVSMLDTDTHARANAALNELKSGADFGAVAKKYTDDATTKENGGAYFQPIDESSSGISPQAADALFKLTPGQYSNIIDAGGGLEIVKNIETNGDKIRAAHIFFKFKEATDYTNQQKDKHKANLYVKL